MNRFFGLVLLSTALLLSTEAHAKSFRFKDVMQKAKDVAGKPYEHVGGNLPGALANIGYDQWRDIKFKDSETLWADDKTPFKVRFFHPGYNFKQPVTVHYVDGKGVHDYPFSSDLFTYGNTGLQPHAAKPGGGFAGFRIHYPLNKPEQLDELVAFLGASYFRALPKDLFYGISARGLVVNIVSADGEEFPFFKEFWVLKAADNAKSITVYALLDSPSVTGAYEYVIKPGDTTVMQVKSMLFFRQDIDKLGVAPMTSMYFYGENTKAKGQGDYRPEVHDSDGLLIETRNGEWVWRALDNPGKLATNGFYVNTPKGFGLLQRDGTFDHYLDLEARYEARPSVWVVPGKWGAGHVELVQIPTRNEYNDNVNVFWVPERQPRAGDALSFNYELQWYSAKAKALPLGFASDTHVMNNDKITRFIIDFEGKNLEALAADKHLNADVSVSKGYRIAGLQVFRNAVTNGQRLVFQIAEEEGWFNDILPSSQPPAELRAVLKDNDKALTETWTYTLLP